MRTHLFTTIPICAIVTIVLSLSVEEMNPAVCAQTEDTVMAKVNGRRITQSEVDNTVTAKLFPLQQQIYELRKTALENLIRRMVLEDEAKRRGIAIEELQREFTATKVEVSQSDVEQSYVENRSAFGSMSPDEAKERLRLDLESQARMRNYRDLLSKLEQSSHIELTLEEPRLAIDSMVQNAPSRGGKTATVTIVEFSDFQCPYCKATQNTLTKVLQTYGNNVRLVFKHLPLEELHPQAFSSARAAFCAQEQGHFWQFHDALFASGDLSLETFDRIATTLALDLPRLKKCIDSEASRTAVMRDVQDARQFGIDGTPTFIINGKLFRGTLSFEDFNRIISAQLKPPQQPMSQK